MSKVAPYWCTEVHIAWRSTKERRRRAKKVARWTASGNWPKKPPRWLLSVKLNHGGSGGP